MAHWKLSHTGMAHTPTRSPHSGRRSFTDLLLSLSPFEKVVATVLVLLVLVSGIVIAERTNESTLISIPRAGGSYSEGIAGTPRFINPLLARSNADKDLTTLVYAGLMTRDGEGNLVPELAERYDISEDGTQYTFYLKHDLTFHDGERLTSDDVLFTVESAANPLLLSTVFADWDGAVAEALDDHTIVFTLPEPYAPFLENTTLGILPKHMWEGLQPDEFQFSQFNIDPIGSGPYRVQTITRDRSGIPQQYELTAFESYTLDTPPIETVTLHLFGTLVEALEAYQQGVVQAVGGITPSHANALMESGATNVALYRAPVLSTISIFYNHNRQPALLRDEVRKALEIATPKAALVGSVLQGYGTVLDSPLPPHIAQLAATSSEDAKEEPGEDETQTGTSTEPTAIERAQAVLERNGWERDEDSGVFKRETDDEVQMLSFSISTVDIPELVAAAELVVESWRAMGADVELKVYDPIDMDASVIRSRQYDALLYGVIPGHELDFYAYWHSSQRNDPGLNVAQFADIEADSLLESMRAETDREVRLELYQAFSDIATFNRAALFLYAPDYIYVTSKEVQHVVLHPLVEPYERFDTIHTWHVDTDRVWPFVRDFVD